MADGNRGAIAAGQLYSAIKLHANVCFVLRIVKEHLALNHLHPRSLRGTHRLTVADGHAIEEVEVVTLQRLHHFEHPVQAGCHRAAHMVV